MARFLPALALLTGCGGTLTVEGVEPFGTVWSAIWIRYDTGPDAFDGLELTNVSDACGKLTDYYAARDAANEALSTLDEEDFCRLGREPYQEFAAAADALVYEGAHFLDLWLQHGGGTTPTEATFTVGSESRTLGGRLTYVESNPYRTILEDWDESASPMEGCGIDPEELDGEFFAADLGSGTLDLGNVEDEAFAAGRLDGELVDSDDVVVGSVDGTFRATFCEVLAPE